MPNWWMRESERKSQETSAFGLNVLLELQQILDICIEMERASLSIAEH